MVTHQTVLITGAAGFLGSAVAKPMRARGWSVVGADRNPPPDVSSFVDFRSGDLSLDGAFEDLVRDVRPACLLHFAGRADVGLSLREPLVDFQLGPVMTARGLEAVRRWSPRTRVVLASSAAVYGQPQRLPIPESADKRPLSPYGYHKWIGEILAREYHEVYGLAVASLRIFSAYGAGLRKQLLWDLCQKCQLGEVVLGGTGEETRDYVHADDVGQAVRLVVEASSFRAESYNVASGNATTVRHMAELVVGHFGLPRERLRFSGQSRPGDPRFWKADVAELRGLGFAPEVTLETGTADYVRWFKAQTGRERQAA